MDNNPKPTENKTVENRTTEISKKVWDLENKPMKVIDVPEKGLDYRMLKASHVREGDIFTAIKNIKVDEKIVTKRYVYSKQGHKIFNLSTGEEV